MTIYRLTAQTSAGTFRIDSTVPYEYAVIYTGWEGLPEASQRRMREHEGVCWSWARDFNHARRLVAEAREDGCLNVFVAKVEARELP
jgi:hypothetical protein